MKILVTGSRGFLGRHLVAALKKEAEVFEIHSQNCDLTRADSLKQFDNQHFDEIYHLASWTQAGDFCLKHPAEQWVINQKINTHMIDFWIEKQRQATFYAMGTSCGYDPNLPLIEENYLKGLPIESLFTYGMTKRMLLTGLQAAHKQYGLSYLYLIPSTLYGPNYHSDGRQLHFIFDLIVKILKGKFHEEQVTLWGDGEQKRELIHVDDFIKALMYLRNSGIKNTHVNIGGGQEFTIKQFAEMISHIIDYPAQKITYDITKYVGARSKFLNTSKLTQIVPNFAPQDPKNGLIPVINWAKSHLLN